MDSKNNEVKIPARKLVTNLTDLANQVLASERKNDLKTSGLSTINA